MIKFQKLGDEEANVEFVQPLVDNSSGESNEVCSKKEGSTWNSLNYFQKVSLWLMILIVALMFSLLVVICIKADNSHHNDHAEENPTTPGLQFVWKTKHGSPTTRAISSTIRSQHMFSMLMGFTFPLQNPISDRRSSYKTTRKIPDVNDILFKESTSTYTSVESKNTVDTDDVHVNTAISPHKIFATTPSAAKRNTVGNHETEMSQDRTTTDVSSVRKYNNNSADADDGVGRGTSSRTTSSSEKGTTIGNHEIELSQERTTMDHSSVKNYTNNSVDADDSVGRGPSSESTSSSLNHEIEISQDRTTRDVSSFKGHTNKSVLDNSDDSFGKGTSPETVFLTKSSTKKPSTTGKNTEMSQDKTAEHVPYAKEHTKNSVDADVDVSSGILPGRM